MNVLIPLFGATITPTASSTQSGFPASNLLKATPRLYWTAASSSVTSATLSVAVTASGYELVPPGWAFPSLGFRHVVLSGVRADAVSLTVGGSAPAGLTTTTYTDPESGKKTWWFTFTELAPVVTVLLTLTKTDGLSSTTLTACNLWIGQIITLTGVRYPLAEGLEDTSIVVPLADGSVYARYRPTLRTFSGEAVLPIADAATFMRGVRRIGGRPTAIHICPELGDAYYVQGQFPAMPAATQFTPTLTSVQFAVREVI